MTWLRSRRIVCLMGCGMTFRTATAYWKHTGAFCQANRKTKAAPCSELEGREAERSDTTRRK